MSNKIRFILISLMILLTTAGCGVKEENTSAIVAAKFNDASFYNATLNALKAFNTPATPTPTTKPQEYSESDYNQSDSEYITQEESNDITFPTESFKSESTDIQNDTTDNDGIISPEEYGFDTRNPWWAVMDDRADIYRHEQLAKLYNISYDDAQVLTEAYAVLSNDAYNLVFYDPVYEKAEMDAWFNLFTDQFNMTLDELVRFVIDGYKNNTISMYDFYGEPDDLVYEYSDYLILPEDEDDGSYPDNEEDLFDYYSVRDNSVDYDEYENEWYQSTYNDYEVEYLPITADGDLLKVGDKVVYSADRLFYYGGTVREIDSYKVKVTWETKGDFLSGPNKELTENDKSINNIIFNPTNIPSDNKWYDALFMTKVSR